MNAMGNKIAVLIMVRDEAKLLPEVLHQYEQQTVFDRLKFSFLEGDSKDNSYDIVQKWCKKYPNQTELTKFDVGAPKWGLDRPRALVNLGMLLRNYHLDSIRNNPWYADCGKIMILDADYLFKDGPKFMENMDKISDQYPTALIAPTPMLQDGRFYDVWCFYKNGREFVNDKPHYPGLFDEPQKNLFPVDSVGACYIFWKEHLQGLKYILPPEGRCVNTGFCIMAQKLGMDVYMDKDIVIYKHGKYGG